MTTPMLEMPNRVVPTGNDTRIAALSRPQLERCLGQVQPLRLMIAGELGPIDIPPAALPLLSQIIAEMSHGRAVSVVADDVDLSVEQTARMLNFPVAHVNQLLDDGTLPCSQFGGERHVKFVDADQYRREFRERRLKVLAELTAEAQEMKWGY